jgi:hypothetical protein
LEGADPDAFAAGGLNGLASGKNETTVGALTEEINYGYAIFDVFIQAGVAYYVGEKYGITASASLMARSSVRRRTRR